MKFSNIWKAFASTLIGLMTGVLTSAATSIAAGEFSWATVTPGIAVAALLSVTDILKEVKKQLDAEAQKENS